MPTNFRIKNPMPQTPAKRGSFAVGRSTGSLYMLNAEDRWVVISKSADQGLARNAAFDPGVSISPEMITPDEILPPGTVIEITT